MALNDLATLVIGAGNFFKAPVGTALPDDLTEIGTPWDNLGHTSLEEILNISSEGGDATSIGTLQNRSLRTKYAAREDTIAVPLQQFDADSLKLYFGSNMEVVEGGRMLGVPDQPTATIVSFLAVFIDEDSVFGLWAPKAEIFRADDISFGDTESLSTLPLGVKPKRSGSNKWTYAITPLGDLDAG